MAKKKRVRCSRCGAKYAARDIRCPACETPNPHRTGTGVTGADRIVGIALVGIGVLVGIPAFMLLPAALRFGSRGKLGAVFLVVFPVGCVAHGALLLSGIHPKDFYSWWGNLPPIQRGLMWCLVGLLVVAGLAIVFIGGQPAEFVDDVLEFD